MEKVQLKSRVAHSYSLRYTGKLLELKKKFKEDKLAVLDFSDENYDWNATNTKTKLAASTGDVRATLNSIKERYIVHESDKDYAITDSGSTEDSPIQNIAYINTGAANGYGINFESIRPSIKVSRIIEEIEDYYGITFTGALKEDYVQDLFCLLHRKDTKNEGQADSDFMSFTSDSDTSTTAILSVFGNLIRIPFGAENTYSVTVTGTNLQSIQLQDLTGNVL